MPTALIILLCLLSLCPIIITADGPLLLPFIPLLLSGGLIIVSKKLPPGEMQHLNSVFSRPLIIGAAIPAGWMIVQMLPLPFLANPIWTSVSPGLPRGVTGSISVDIGATALALVHYLSAAGMLLFAAAVTVNRERAETILISATAAAALVSVACLVQDLFVEGYFGINILAHREQAFDIACLGVILSAACGLFVFERHETRGVGTRGARRKFLLALAACLVSFVLCAGAIAVTRAGSLIFAAGSGFLTFIAVAAIRRWALGRLGAAAISVTAAVIAIALVTVAASDPDPRFAFVKKSRASIELTQRILSNAPFFGVGAGSFMSLKPIYQSGDPSARDAVVVTAAAKLSGEMGKVMLWFAVLAASMGVFVLLRGASRRGRDSFYAAAAGACLVTLMILGFINTAVTGSAIVLLSGAVLGLGLTQSKSRVVS